MKNHTIFALFLIGLGVVNAYSKYGRTCKDIGCAPNEMCVMANDPCRRRDEPCGEYPTCQRVSNQKLNCQTFVCPPTTVCITENDHPKCVDESTAGHKISDSRNDPSAPHLYPQIPHGETTTRAPMYRPGYPSNGGGYQGGSIGSGYPGQPNQQRPSNYPGYPGGSNYPAGSSHPGGSNYPQSNYPGYPNQGGSYPGYNGYPNQNGYPMQPGYTGYNGQNPNQGRYPSGNNYNPYGGSQYGNSGATTSSPIYDKIADTLKNIGLFCIVLHNLVARMHAV